MMQIQIDGPKIFLSMKMREGRNFSKSQNMLKGEKIGWLR